MIGIKSVFFATLLTLGLVLAGCGQQDGGEETAGAGSSPESERAKEHAEEEDLRHSASRRRSRMRIGR